MTPRDLLAFARRHRLAVQASTSAGGAPQAAVVGVVFGDRFEAFFDTLESTRKCKNLRQDPRAALVVGWDMDVGCTLQIEGLADEPSGAELAALQSLYFATVPDGLERKSWPGITYFRVRPTWMRFGDFTGPEPRIVELDEFVLAGL